MLNTILTLLLLCEATGGLTLKEIQLRVEPDGAGIMLCNFGSSTLTINKEKKP
jgi:hypothetical protein